MCGSLSCICSVILSRFITYNKSEIGDFVCLVSVSLITCMNSRLVISNRQRAMCTVNYSTLSLFLACSVELLK